MKRYIFALMLFPALLPGVLRSQIQGVAKMLGSKHDLTVVGAGPIRASTETQLCVFCHTPHVPRQEASAQLWNHQASSAEYTLYSSDYLTKLNYAVPNQPNARSKLCLSCHDGTVALGSVYNNGGPRVIAMQNGVTTMPEGSPGFIGTSLTNDHPVGYIYDNARDPELVSRDWPWATPIRLDPDASSGTVECITCHEPHDNQFTNFLRVTTVNSALCTFCHNKSGWADAVHKTSTQSYTPPGGTTTTLGETACRSCHESHNGPGIPYLLTGVEENTCFSSGCHGDAQVGPNTKNIEAEYQKLYDHPTVTVSGKHKDPDDASSLDLAHRHAECQDCHNSHYAKKGLHTPGSNAVAPTLLGVRGVLPGAIPPWQQPTVFTEIRNSTQEGQICLKCHSSFAFGQVPGGTTTIVGPSGINITDQAMEFNPANHAAHPVQVSSNDQTGALTPKGLLPNQLAAPWIAAGTQTMYCSDCHGNDQQTSTTIPQGPHGSNARFMLTGNGRFWPASSFGQLWSLDDIRNNKNNWQNDLFCVNCHPMFDGLNFTNNVHAGGNHQGTDVKCITCHVTVPHGSQRSRLIGYASEAQPWNYSGTGTYDHLVIAGFHKASGPTGYVKEDCSMNGVCHGTQAGFYEP